MSEASKLWYVRKNIHADQSYFVCGLRAATYLGGTAYVRDEKGYEIAFCQTVKDAERIVQAVNSREIYEEALCRIAAIDGPSKQKEIVREALEKAGSHE